MAMEFRQAVIGDTPHLARFAIMMGGGVPEALYEDLIPEQPIESIVEPNFSNSEATDFYENHWIAELDSQVAGGMHAFPFDNFANDTLDPRIPEDRYELLEPFFNLPADGTYFVNALSVYPEYCRKGIGSSLLSLALNHGKEKGFTQIALWVFAENTGAVELYKKSGLEVVGREPVVEHPLIRYKGEAFLMTASL